MAAEFKGGEQRPRCEQEEGKKRGRRLFEAVNDSAHDEKALRKLLAPVSSWKARAWEKWRVSKGKGRDGVGLDVDGPKVCADADEVNEVQYLLQVQEGDVEYSFELWASGEWPRCWRCNDEAGCLRVRARAGRGVRWPPAASDLRTLAAAPHDRCAWIGKQMTPEMGIERPEGLKKQEPAADAVRLRGSGSGSGIVGARVRGCVCVWVRAACCLLACRLARFLREGVGSQQRGRNRKSNTRREGFPFRRWRSRRQRRRLMGQSGRQLSVVVGTGGGTRCTRQAHKPKRPGVTEVRTTAVCPGWVDFRGV
jgi:hypothetical protein